MNKRSPVSAIMTKQVIVANIDNSFSQVMEFFNTWRIQHLPVTFSDKLIGILSINDLISFTYKHLGSGKIDFEELDAKFSIREVMTADPISLLPTETIEDAFKILAAGEFQALPVIDNGRLIGIVTNKDLVKWYGGNA